MLTRMRMPGRRRRCAPGLCPPEAVSAGIAGSQDDHTNPPRRLNIKEARLTCRRINRDAMTTELAARAVLTMPGRSRLAARALSAARACRPGPPGRSATAEHADAPVRAGR
jgi:hypothetical protein